MACRKLSTTSSIYTSGREYAASLTWMGRPRAMLWQKVATTLLYDGRHHLPNTPGRRYTSAGAPVSRSWENTSSSASRLDLP